MHDEGLGIEYEFRRREDIDAVIHAGHAEILGPGANAQSIQHAVQVRPCRAKAPRCQKGRPENHPYAPRLFRVRLLERPLRTHRATIREISVARPTMPFHVKLNAIVVDQNVLLFLLGQFLLRVEIGDNLGR